MLSAAVNLPGMSPDIPSYIPDTSRYIPDIGRYIPDTRRVITPPTYVSLINDSNVSQGVESSSSSVPQPRQPVVVDHNNSSSQLGSRPTPKLELTIPSICEICATSALTPIFHCGATNSTHSTLNPLPVIHLCINGRETTCLLDTGSVRSLLSADF